MSTSRRFALAGRDGGEFAQLLYVMLIPHCDDFGRQSGDTFTVKHQILPASTKTEEEFDAALAVLARHGLIQRYQAGEEWVIQVTQWEQHQSGLHKRTASRFPEIPGSSGNPPEIPLEVEEKGTEGKRTEVNGTRHAPGPLAGSLPRDHIDHAFCGARICVTHKTWATMARGYGDGAEAAIEGWLRSFDASIGPDQSVGNPVWLLQHWDAHLASIGRIKAAPKPQAKPRSFRGISAALEAK